MRSLILHIVAIASLISPIVAKAGDFYLVPPTIFLNSKGEKATRFEASFEIPGPSQAVAIIEDSSLADFKSGTLVVEGYLATDKWEYSAKANFSQEKVFAYKENYSLVNRVGV